MLLSLFLLQLAGEFLLLDADDVFTGDNHQPEVAVRHVQLDVLRIRACLLGCLEELLCCRLTVLVGVCQYDVAVLEEDTI